MSTTLKRIVVGFGMALAVVSGTAFFYISRYFWKVQDVESDFEQIAEQTVKVITTEKALSNETI